MDRLPNKKDAIPMQSFSAETADSCLKGIWLKNMLLELHQPLSK